MQISHRSRLVGFCSDSSQEIVASLKTHPGFTCDTEDPARRARFHPEARRPKWSCSASRLLAMPAERFLSPHRNGRSLRKQPQGCGDNWDLCREKVARPVSRTQLLDSHRESKHPARSRGAKPNCCEAQGLG